MSKIVLVAEKPSVAMAIAQALGVRGERKDGYIEDDRYIVTWCVGHLVAMSYPEVYDEKYKVWETETLPFIPEKEKYLYEIIDSVKKQFKIVKSVYNRNDISKIVIYPDPAQEGFYLQELVLREAGTSTKQIYCAWVDSQTEEEIIKAYNECKPWNTEKFQQIIQSGYMRAKEDYLFGINFSRVLTLKYSENISSKLNHKITIAVGRVMSCVLGMVVQREREIANFEVTPFYKINAFFEGVNAEWKAIENTRYFQSPEVYNDVGFLQKEKASKFISNLDTNITVNEVEMKTEKKFAPLLFNLAELQSECSKRFKISPSKTLEIAQELYEKKLTTYPRTDARVLTTAMAKVIEEHIEGIKNNSPICSNFAETILNENIYKKLAFTKYVDDSKVSDHYAIIPTGKGYEQYNNLTEQEKLVYELILRRFLSIFMPPAEYKKVQLSATCNGEFFHTAIKQLSKEGYMEVYQYNKENEDKKTDVLDKICGIKSGMTYPCEFSIIEGKTTPPKRYNSGSIILAMENAGQLIEDEELRESTNASGGIGTSATRAEILRKLIKNEYLHLNDKTQIISPEYKGELIYDVINNTIPGLLNPKLGASWTKGLKQIESGEINDTEYYDKLLKYISSEVSNVKETDKNPEIYADFRKTDNRYRDYIEKMSIRERCPICKKKLKVTSFGVCCENYGKEEGKCRFAISKNISGKTLTDSQLQQLLKNKRLDIMKGFKTKDGKEFSAPLYILSDGKLSFKPEEGMEIDDLRCPCCDCSIEEESYKWSCKNEYCSFEVPRTYGNKTLNRTHLKKLLTEGKTDLIKGFKGKSEKEFSAFLKLDSDYKVVYQFRDGEVDSSEYKCPICKKPIIYTPFGLACANFGKEAGNCKFALSNTISHKSLSDQTLLKLIKDGETSEISGFKNKDKTKEFSASLFLKDDGSVGFRFRDGYIEDCKCPKCKKNMVYTSFGVACENYGKEVGKCSFALSNTICKKKISDATLVQLVKTGKTKELSGFKSKTGNSFSASLYLKEDFSLAFELPKSKEETSIHCPKCNQPLVAGKYKIGCERCKIQVPYVFAKKQLSADDVCALITKGRTEKISGFKSKSGKKFSARIVKNKKGEFEFEFEQKN